MARKLRRRRIWRPCGNAWSVQTGCGMGTPLRKATAQKRAPRIFPHGKQTKPGPAPRRGIGGGLRAGRAAAVRRATLPVLWRIGQDAMCSVCHCPPLASRPETQWARYGFTDRAAVSLRATLPVLRRTGRDAGAFPRQANRIGGSTTSRDRRRLARRPCSCCPARHPCPYCAAHRTRRPNRTSTRSIAQATVRRMHGRLCPGRRIPG